MRTQKDRARFRVVAAFCTLILAFFACQKSDDADDTARKVLTPNLKPDVKPIGAEQVSGTVAGSAPGETGRTAVTTLPVTKVRTDRAAAGSFRRATFTVDATKDNNFTGWWVNPGETIRVKASGAWSTNPEEKLHDADGVGYTDEAGCRSGMLAAYVANYTDAWHEEYTCVGVQGEHKVKIPGLLFFVIWDYPREGNSGSVEIEIERVADPSVAVPPLPPAWTAEETYGEFTFDVSAVQLWNPTGLYLRAGDTVEVSARGRINIYPEKEREMSVEAPELSVFEGCLLGALRGLIVDPTKGPAGDVRLCIGRDQAFVAPADGHFFLGITDGWTVDNSGSLKVTMRSSGRRIPERWSAEDFGVKALAANVAAESHGTRLLRLAANAGWTNTGLYLAAGQKARIEARGGWAHYAGMLPNPDAPDETGRLLSCRYGQLRAVVGYELKDLATRIVCIGQSMEITAARDGPVLLSIVDGSDYLYDNFGILGVVVQSDDGRYVPDVDLARLPMLDVAALSGFVELRGARVSAVVPAAALATAGAAAAGEAMQALDAAADAIVGALGNSPRHQTLVQMGLDTDLSGNAKVAIPGLPMRLAPSLFDQGGVDGAKLLDAASFGGDPEHEILATLATSIMSRAHPQHFAPGSGPLRAWSDFFVGEAAARLGFAYEWKPCDSEEARAYKELGGSFDELQSSRDVAGCLLTEMIELVGKDVMLQYLAFVNTEPEESQPAWYADPIELYAFMRTKLEELSGKDLKPLFASYKL